MAGKIRFGRIYIYKSIENTARKDETEGVSCLVVDGTSTQSMFARTCPYVYCFHRTLQAAENSEFGRFIVSVNSPRDLADDITRVLPQLDEKFWGGVQGIFVEYTKGDSVSTIPSGEEMARLNYAQKPGEFELEEEFRMVVLSARNSNDYLPIDIGKPINDCSLLYSND